MTFLTVKQAKYLQDIRDQLFSWKNDPHYWTNNKRRLSGLPPLRGSANKQDRFRPPASVRSNLFETIASVSTDSYNEIMSNITNNFALVQNVPYGTIHIFAKESN